MSTVEETLARPVEPPEPHAPKSPSQMVQEGPRSSWRSKLAHRVRQISDELVAVEAAPGDPAAMAQYRLAKSKIAEAERVITISKHGPARFQNWVSGMAIETSWGLITEAEDALILCQPLARLRARLPSLEAGLRSNLQAADPRLDAYVDYLAKLVTTSDAQLETERPTLREIQRTINSASAEAHANVRSFRNLLAAVGAILVALLAGVAVLAAAVPSFLDLSSGAGGGSPRAWEVMVMGALGGMLGAILTVTRLGGFSGPYRLPAYQAMMRVPMGAATAMAGAVLLQSSLIGALKPQPTLPLLAYCLAFGYAPDVLLRYLDRKVADVLDQAKDKNDPSAPPSSAPAPAAEAVR